MGTGTGACCGLSKLSTASAKASSISRTRSENFFVVPAILLS